MLDAQGLKGPEKVSQDVTTMNGKGERHKLMDKDLKTKSIIAYW